MVRRMLERLLTRVGCLVVRAASIADAREITRSRPQLALAVVDLTLPDGNGLVLVTEMRSVLGADAPPVITFSGHERMDPLPRGVVAALKKPARIDEILAAVRSALEPSRRFLGALPRSEPPRPRVDRIRDAIGSSLRGHPRPTEDPDRGARGSSRLTLRLRSRPRF